MSFSGDFTSESTKDSGWSKEMKVLYIYIYIYFYLTSAPLIGPFFEQPQPYLFYPDHWQQNGEAPLDKATMPSWTNTMNLLGKGSP